MLGSRSGIRPTAGPIWLRYGLNAMLGLVARDGVTGKVVFKRKEPETTLITKQNEYEVLSIVSGV